MRAFVLSFILTATATAAFAQEPARQSPGNGAPDLTVVKQSWSKERIGWERDPFGGPVGYSDQIRMRARNEKRIEDAKRGGSSADTERARRDAATDRAIVERARQQGDGPPRYAFLYKASFANNGAKAVRETDWDYVFFDKMTGEEIGRHQFTSAGRIEPHKRKEFSFYIPSPPARRISVYDLGRRERDGLGEQVVVVRVLYEDGTEWRRP